MSPHGYRLYGLTLHARLELPCRPAARASHPDVRLVAARAAQFPRTRVRRPAASGWFHYRRLADGAAYLRWTENFEFLVSADGRRILYRPLEHATPEALHVHLLGQVLSFSLLARGRDPLHGTVVAIRGSAVAFVGGCGEGKSTLAAALVARGHRLVTDDVVALRRYRGGWAVHPGIPRLKLAPRVVQRVLGARDEAPRMIYRAAKRVIPLSPAEHVDRLMPLRAIYVLERRPATAGRDATPEPRIEPLSGGDAFLQVIRAAFNLVVLERRRYANQFAFASRLVADVPVRRLMYPRDLSRLPGVCDMVIADAAAL